MKNAILFLFIFTICSCASKADRKISYTKEAPMEVERVDDSENGRSIQESESDDVEEVVGNLPNLQNRKLIKTANYQMQVENVDASTLKIQDFTQKMGGIISNMNLTSNTYRLQNSISILVPHQNFEILLKDISKEAIFMNQKEIKTSDVTEEFVDIQARLNTKKEVRDRYAKILRSKASTVEEVLLTEEKIRILQEEIEAKEGRLNYLQEKVTNSQIHLVIYETVIEKEEPITYQASIGIRFKENLRSGWDIVMECILMIVNIWPILLVAMIVFFFRGRF